MKAEGLRINNLVSRTNKLTKENLIIELTASCILDIHANGEMSSFIYEPIQLTEEWLLKFGFEKKTYRNLTLYYFSLKVLSHGEIAFHPKDQGFNIDLGTTTGYQFGRTQIKSVHQLQNLYFALTQTELTL